MAIPVQDSHIRKALSLALSACAPTVSVVGALVSIYFAIASDQSARVTLISSKPVATDGNVEYYDSVYLVFNNGRHPIYVSELSSAHGGYIQQDGAIPYDHRSPTLSGGPNLSSKIELASPITLQPGETTEIRLLDSANIVASTSGFAFDIEAGSTSSDRPLRLPNSMWDLNTRLTQPPTNDDKAKSDIAYTINSLEFFGEIAQASLDQSDTQYYKFGIAGYEGTSGCTNMFTSEAIVLGCTNLELKLTTGEAFSSGDSTIGRRIEFFYDSRPPPPK